MAGKMSREKGARGEREVLALLQTVVNEVYEAENENRRQGGKSLLVMPVLKRNYSQRFVSKQYDIEGLDWMALEVKRVENPSGLGSWWQQCCNATRTGQTSILFWRQNNARWKVRMVARVKVEVKHVRMVVDMDAHSFLVWFRQKLIEDIARFG